MIPQKKQINQLKSQFDNSLLIKSSTATPADAFSTIDINSITTKNGITTVVFRGLLKSNIANNNAFISNLPKPASSGGITLLIGIGGEYDIETVKWAYISKNEVKGPALTSGKWVHISWTYISN